METFDYVIVGAGSAGSVLANRLGEDPNVTICVLEAGPPDLSPFIHIPAGFIYTIKDPKINWLYETEPTEWTAGRAIQQPRGKTLGGSSSINGHIYTRGNRMDYDGWAQRGNRGWGYADVLPYFKRSENRVGEGDNTFRGRGGPLTVTDIDWSHPLTDAFIEGVQTIGIPKAVDYNGAKQEGATYSQRTIAGGRRMSTARAFLRPAQKRGNVHVITNAHATKIILDGKRATGVAYNKGGRNGKPKQVMARREVILSGGTINSPQLLQVSGIGAPDLLQSLGIEVKHALPGVGENLRDHYAPRFTARVKNVGSLNERTKGLNLLSEIARWGLTRKGILSLSPTLVYCFWRSNPDLDNNDVQFTFTPASYKEGVQSELDDFPGMTIASWQQRPESSGYVRAKTADPFDKPAINPRYLEHEMDRQVLLAAMRLARRMLTTEPMMRYFDHWIYPTDDLQSDDELLQVARERGTTTFHPMGTCRMAPDSDPTAVVDDQLRVYGLEGLRVVDASIMPMMPSANLNAPTIMIAEKASDMIRGKAAPEPVILKD
ncbi:MAG: GMC family oxidoreductase N-terminal domain-containing protein [Rhodospirillales bacterium]|nr:GMC family oxidoreductase N-terminal domain-containing protein [Rhodospirillales bacterium]MBO6788671.1 GMC family oxidoreductase N-terminal domain-containing protein [Rhodospirillales bacterium]